MDVAIERFVEELKRLGPEYHALTNAGARLLVTYAGQLGVWSTAREFFPRAAALIRDAHRRNV
jgi:hypothetical protein